MGSPTDADRAWVIGELARSAERCAPRPEAGARHQEAAFRLGRPEHEQLHHIAAPTLILHGTDDQSLPVAHARAFDRGIHTTELHLVDGMSHLPNEREWQLVARLLIDHVLAVGS